MAMPPAESMQDESSAERGHSTASKRIALVIHALYGGGAERLMSQLANRWCAAGHQVHLVTLAHVSTDKYSISAGVVRHGLDLMETSHGLMDAARANWQRVHQLRKVLADLSPDCILSFCDRMNIATVTAALPLGKPLWIAEHSDPSRQHLGLVWETWRQWAYRRLARRPSTGCVVLTDDIAEIMRKRFPGLQLATIPPAIDLSHCTNTIVRGPEFGVEAIEGQPQVLAMGRHSPEKNLTALLGAWESIASEFPQWRLVLAGNGPQHSELINLVRQMRSGDSVHFAGWVSDPWSLYRQSSLLAMTSHYEGVPVAMLEAMASGLACVSTPCAPVVLRFAEAGGIELAKSTSVTDIASALRVAMADVRHRERLSARGRVLAARYSWDDIGPQWDALLSKLV